VRHPRIRPSEKVPLKHVTRCAAALAMVVVVLEIASLLVGGVAPAQTLAPAALNSIGTPSELTSTVASSALAAAQESLASEGRAAT
jgi:hypothetical protein